MSEQNTYKSNLAEISNVVGQERFMMWNNIVKSCVIKVMHIEEDSEGNPRCRSCEVRLNDGVGTVVPVPPDKLYKRVQSLVSDITNIVIHESKSESRGWVNGKLPYHGKGIWS